MIVFRILGSWCLIVAIIALAYDGTRSIGSNGELVITPLGRHWLDIHPASLSAAQAAVETKVSPWLWDPIIAGLLSAPAWLAFGLLGIFFYFLGRKRKRIDIFAN